MKSCAVKGEWEEGRLIWPRERERDLKQNEGSCFFSRCVLSGVSVVEMKADEDVE